MGFIAPRLDVIKPSPSMAVTARAIDMRAAGIDVISLSAGEPDFPTPTHVVEAAYAAMRRGETRYTAVDGTVALKKAVADKFRRENGLDYRPSEITVAGGAKQIIYNALLATLAPGDEVIASDWDYGSMVEAWEQRARDEGIGLRLVEPPLHPRSDDEVVDCFAAAITPRTRVLHLTHLIHYTGQLLPVRRLCQLGRERGLLVIVDAAHSFAQVPFTPAELDCDFLGASLHKWLAAPLGLGVLWVRRDRIAGLRPLFGDTRRPADDIRRLEHFGNRPDAPHLGLREAIRWHEAIGGAAAKRARLSLLQRRWTEAARGLPRVEVLTPADPERHGSLGAFRIEGLEPAETVARLMGEHRIFVNEIRGPRIRAVRATVGLPTSPADVDRLVEALAQLSRRA